MPRTRTYTDAGYVEVQWSKKGELVCLVSADVTIDDSGEHVTSSTMHQFTARGDMGVLMRDLRRARRQAFGPFGEIPVLDPERAIQDGHIKKADPASIKYLN